MNPSTSTQANIVESQTRDFSLSAGYLYGPQGSTSHGIGPSAAVFQSFQIDLSDTSRCGANRLSHTLDPWGLTAERFAEQPYENLESSTSPKNEPLVPPPGTNQASLN